MVDNIMTKSNVTYQNNSVGVVCDNIAICGAHLQARYSFLVKNITIDKNDQMCEECLP